MQIRLAMRNAGARPAAPVPLIATSLNPARRFATYDCTFWWWPSGGRTFPTAHFSENDKDNSECQQFEVVLANERFLFFKTNVSNIVMAGADNEPTARTRRDWPAPAARTPILPPRATGNENALHPIRDIHLVAATLASGMLAARPDQGAEAAAKYYFQILDALQNKAEFPSGVPAPRFSGQGHAPDTPGSWPAGPRSPEPRQQQSVGSSGARQVWP